MENTPQITPDTTAIDSQPANPIKDANTEASGFDNGGFVSLKKDFKPLYYLSFGLLITASIYSIYYHRQALNELVNKSKEQQLIKDVNEVKKNLKKLLRSNYEYAN